MTSEIVTLLSKKKTSGLKFLMKIDPTMDNPSIENSELVRNSVLYKEFLAEREEILAHKWLESEKAGYDIGFERALLDWIVRHRSAWRERRHREQHSHELSH
jgi:hypothetical protein